MSGQQDCCQGEYKFSQTVALSDRYCSTLTWLKLGPSRLDTSFVKGKLSPFSFYHANADQLSKTPLTNNHSPNPTVPYHLEAITL